MRRAALHREREPHGAGLPCLHGQRVAPVNRYATPTDETIVPSLLDYLRVLGRRKLPFLLIVLLVPAAAVAVSLNQAPTYRASAEVLLNPRNLEAAYIESGLAAESG